MKIATILVCSIVLVFNGMQSAQRPSKIKQKQLSIVSPQLNEKIFFRHFFQKKHQLPMFSLKEIAYSFDRLSLQDKEKMNEKSNSLLLCVALLPQEVRREIIIKMLGDAQSVELFDTLPMLTSFDYYEKVKHYDPLKVGNKTYSVGRLFRLAVSSPIKFHELVEIGNPSIIDRLVIGKTSDLVTKDDCEKIPKMPKDIGEGLELKVINESYLSGCRQIAGFYCAGTCFFFCINLSAIATIFGCCIGMGCCCTHHHCIEHNAISVRL